ncbi:MAG: DAK2 domain-containing protein [Acidimicrobiales bacterium]
MAVLTAFGVEEVRGLISTFRDALANHREAINRLNVYPVPDGDTGTNMTLTLESVLAEIDGAGADMEATCAAISHGSLMGARGNSGVILSQVLRGIASTFASGVEIGGRSFANALDVASKAAYQAVMKPVEGTILTVVREAAEAATAAVEQGKDQLVDVLDAARARAVDALSRTPEMLPVLKEAGVVDAGGAGFILLLDAALNIADGRPLPDPPEGDVAADLVAGFERPDEHDGDVSDLRYEVMFFLEAEDDTIAGFKDVWVGVGDSIVVVGGDGIWNCHIHTNDIGAAIEAAVDVGRPRQIRVTDLAEEVAEERWVREAAAQSAAVPLPQRDPVGCAVVAVSPSDGIGRIFHSLGVQELVTGGQTMNPSTADLLAAVEAAPSDMIVVLPNNKNIIPVARQVNDHTAKTVVVVPTTSVAEGFACLLAYDPDTDAHSNASGMADIASGVVVGEITQAVRDTNSDAGPVKVGDWIGLDRSGIRVVRGEMVEAAIRLLDRLVTDDHEIVSVIEGADAGAADTRAITEWLSEHRPAVEVEVHKGEQPFYPYYFGVE